MERSLVLRLGVPVALVAAGVVLSAQIQPSSPQRQFGASVTPAYEGWFDNADGTHSFLIGYFNRNTEAEVDVPIGPNNYFEPGDADMGQPTHFLPRRRFGVFVVRVPADFPRTQRIAWVLTVNGQTNRVPFHMHTDYNISPMKSSEESPDGTYNVPPVLRFSETGPSFAGPALSQAAAIPMTATVGTPMPLELWADDDAGYSSGANAPMLEAAPPVNVTITKYRGPGTVTVGARPIFEALVGGKALEPYRGRASTTLSFSAPGDYLVHMTGNDYSGNGGGGSGCCWTNALLRVAVAAR
jgi:hypothetical protein